MTFVQHLQDCGAEVVNYAGQAYPHLQNCSMPPPKRATTPSTKYEG